MKIRILQFIAYLAIPQNEFCRQCQIPQSTINRMSTGLHSDTIFRIKARYPELNLDWLVMGSGRMLIKMSSQ
jgi:hypothetical protein